ncbi:MAG: hypothetical protein ABFR05_10000 [Bacteroidota bacterium]
MKFKIGTENKAAEEKLAADFPDNSGIGVHYMDAYLKPFNSKMEGEYEVKSKRRGLKVSLKINGEIGHGLMRRLDVSTDPKVMMQAALKEAAENAGYNYSLENGEIWFDKAN